MSDETSMNEHAREIIGQLCRWTLLAVTGTGLLAYVGGSVTFGPLAVGPTSARLRTVDVGFVPQPGKRLGSRMYLVPLDAQARFAPVISIGPDGATDVWSMRGRRGWVRLPWAGLEGFIEVKGAPYAALAFQQRRVWVQPRREDVPVIFVDARMILASADDPRRSHRLIRALTHSAEVVLFSESPIGPGHQEAQLLAHGSAPPIPLVSRLGGAGKAIRSFAREVGLKDKPVAITADPDLAARLARIAHTHLVGPLPAPDVPEGARLTYHSNMDALIDTMQVEFAAQATQPTRPAVVPAPPRR